MKYVQVGDKIVAEALSQRLENCGIRFRGRDVAIEPPALVVRDPAEIDVNPARAGLNDTGRGVEVIFERHWLGLLAIANEVIE